MIKEAIESIKMLAENAAAPKAPTPLSPPGERKGRYLLAFKDGTTEWHQAEQEPRQYKLFTLDDLAVAAGKLVRTGKQAVVFAGRGAVSVLLDETGERGERLTLALPNSKQFQIVNKWPSDDDEDALLHADFIDLLWIDLCDCVHEDVVDTFRLLDFKRSDAGASVVQAGSASINQSGLRELTFKGAKPPEEIALAVCIYSDLVDDAVRQTIRCAVKIDLEKCTLRLIPKAGEIEKAQRETDAYIQTFLKGQLGDSIPVFCGLA